MGNYSRLNVASFCCCLMLVVGPALAACPTVGIKWHLYDYDNLEYVDGAGGGSMVFDGNWNFKSPDQTLVFECSLAMSGVEGRIQFTDAWEMMYGESLLEEWDVEEIYIPDPPSSTPFAGKRKLIFTPAASFSSPPPYDIWIEVVLQYPGGSAETACHGTVPPDRDTDSDGIPDYRDPDDDGDGTPDDADSDDDGDGIPDSADTDSSDNPDGKGPDQNGDGEAGPSETGWPEDDPEDPDPPTTEPSEDCPCCAEIVAALEEIHGDLTTAASRDLADISESIEDDVQQILVFLNSSLYDQGGDVPAVGIEEPTTQPFGGVAAMVPNLAGPGNMGFGTFTDSPVIPSGSSSFTLPLSIGMMGQSPIVGDLVIDASWYVGSPVQTVVNLSLIALCGLGGAWMIFNEFKRQ